MTASFAKRSFILISDEEKPVWLCAHTGLNEAEWVKQTLKRRYSPPATHCSR
ncbi:protein of unknown function [Caballeronia sp. S22]